MATIQALEVSDGASARPQGEVVAKVRLVEIGSEKFIQIDTCGRPGRQEVGKLSQSIRLSKNALDQLIQLGSKHL